MMWYLFLIIIFMSGFFMLLGYQTKTRLWVQLGALFLIFLGFQIIATGLDIPTGSAVLGLI